MYDPLGWVNVKKVFKIMSPPNSIILVPKASPSEKFKKYINAKGGPRAPKFMVYAYVATASQK